MNEFHPQSGYKDPEGGGVLGAIYLGGSSDEGAPDPGLGSLVVETHCWRTVPSRRRARGPNLQSPANHGSGWQPTLANRYQAFSEKEMGVLENGTSRAGPLVS